MHGVITRDDINPDISFSLEPGKEKDKDFKIEELSEKSSQKKLDHENLKSTHRGIIHSMSLPSFNLNIKNKHSSQLLIILISLQILTNAFLLLILFYRL